MWGGDTGGLAEPEAVAAGGVCGGALTSGVGPVSAGAAEGAGGCCGGELMCGSCTGPLSLGGSLQASAEIPIPTSAVPWARRARRFRRWLRMVEAGYARI